MKILPTNKYKLYQSPPKGEVKEDEQIYNAGLLPEIGVSALTDATYNTLSNPQKQVYDTFVTPDGIAQTVDIGERYWDPKYNSENSRLMHWKGALQMTEDLGVRNIHNKPIDDRVMYPNGHFRPHALPANKDIYIPKHNEYHGEQAEGGSTYGEQRDRSKYFENLIAESAHIPEHDRIDSLWNRPITALKRAYRYVKEGEMPDASNYTDPHDIEYKTHTGPNSYEEKLRSKYEMYNNDV